MRHYGIHPAAGVGAFVPGFFYAPENPVEQGARGYAHYVPDARHRIAESRGSATSALAKSLSQAGAFEGSTYDLGLAGCPCSGLGGCSCSGPDYGPGSAGQIDLTEATPSATGIWGANSILGGGGLPVWAHIAIGASIAGVLVGVLGVKRR